MLEQTPLHVNSLGLLAAEVAFSGACDDWLAALREYLTANRDCLVEFVARELPGVRVTAPDATYLAWLDFKHLSLEHLSLEGKDRPQGTGEDEPAAVRQDPYRFFLDRARVALNPGAQFGPGGETCLRLNFGCPHSTLVEALRRMKDAV